MSTSPSVKAFFEAPMTLGPGHIEGPGRTLKATRRCKGTIMTMARVGGQAAARTQSKSSVLARCRHAVPIAVGDATAVRQKDGCITLADDDAVPRLSGAEVLGHGHGGHFGERLRSPAPLRGLHQIWPSENQPDASTNGQG